MGNPKIDAMMSLDDIEFDEFDFEPAGTLGDLISEVASDGDISREYLRARFIEQAISTLRHTRYDLGLTQKDIADALGTKQPAIARLEKAEDITLGKMWDYLYACGKTPLPIQTVEFESLRDFAVSYPDRPITLNSVLSHRLIGQWQTTTNRSEQGDRHSFEPFWSVLAQSFNTIFDTLGRRAADPLSASTVGINQLPSESNEQEPSISLRSLLVKNQALAEKGQKPTSHQAERVA